MQKRKKTAGPGDLKSLSSQQQQSSAHSGSLLSNWFSHSYALSFDNRPAHNRAAESTLVHCSPPPGRYVVNEAEGNAARGTLSPSPGLSQIAQRKIKTYQHVHGRH